MNIKILIFDIDETLIDSTVDNNDFYVKWIRTSFSKVPLLCYNTGRLLDDTRNLVAKRKIPEPDYIISGVGTSIYDYDKRKVIKEFSHILEEGWDLEKVSDVMHTLDGNLEKQPDQFQNDYKSSWFLEDATPDDINEIERKLSEKDLDINVVYSSSKHLDILPKWANKGNSLVWLLKFLKIKPAEAIVAGDSGNDSAMFQIPDINGIVVGNAQPELYHETKGLSVYYSEKPGYKAVFEGLDHFGLQRREITPEKTKLTTDSINLAQLNLMEVEEVEGIKKKQFGFYFEGLP